MTMDEPETSPGRQPRVGESGAPVGSILSIVLAVVAVIVGFVILKQINDDDDSGAGPTPINPTNAPSENGEDTTTTAEDDENGSTTTTAPAGPENTFKGAKVQVANAADIGGAAADMTDKLKFVGFTTGAPTDAGGDEARVDKTKVYFVRGNSKARDVAETVGRALGGAPVAPMPAEIPTEDGELDGAVLVLLGPDRANKNLARL